MCLLHTLFRGVNDTKNIQQFFCVVISISARAVDWRTGQLLSHLQGGDNVYKIVKEYYLILHCKICNQDVPLKCR